MKNDPLLKHIPFTLSLLGLISFGISVIFFKTPTIYLGVLLGFILVIANFVFLTKIIAKLLDEHYKGKPFLALLFFLKLCFVGGVVFLAFWVFQVHFIAFLVGYMSLVPVVVFAQLFSGAKN